MPEMPINLRNILVALLKLLAVDAFRTEDLIIYVLNLPETQSYNHIFEEAGMEGANFFALIGPLFMIIVVYSTYMVIQLLTRYICWD